MGNVFGGLFGGGGNRPAPAPTPPPIANFDTVVQGVQPNCFEQNMDEFNICLDLQLSSNDRLAAFENARNRWESVITGQSGVRRNFQSFMRSFGRRGDQYASQVNQLPTVLDDVFIAGFEQSIDGRGGILGFAGPDFVYQDTGLTLSGSMFFDSVDIERLLRSDPDSWTNIVEHEMGHVLGIGTLWESKGVVTRRNQNGRTTYTYNGNNAQREWESICGDSPLPIEEDGGEGTAGGHFDEECLQGELMTGFLGGSNPLSRITVATLEDLGYSVDYSSAAPFTSRDVNRRCCNSRRGLRREEDERELFFDKLPELDVDLIFKAAQEAFNVLTTFRRSVPSSIPEGVEYVGGDRITVFVFDEQDNVRDLGFRWDDVKDMFDGLAH